MGRSITLHYVLHIRCSDHKVYTPMEWKARSKPSSPGYGRPTTENIDKWVTTFEDSCKPGECNAHLGRFSVTEAWIINQKDGNTIVCRWKRSEVRKDEPLFQLL